MILPISNHDNFKADDRRWSSAFLLLFCRIGKVNDGSN